MYSSVIGFLHWCVFKDRSKDVMLQLYKSLIRSRLEYSCPLWDPTGVRDIEEIKQVQRYFTRRIAKMSSKNYWERLSTLKLQSLQSYNDVGRGT